MGRKIKVLSLFDGISVGRYVLDQLGVECTYYASEIDEHAIAVSKDNYPDIVHLGDVRGWREWRLPWAFIDLIIAGSPCQGFSYAGHKLAFDDPRSKLFFHFVDILEWVQKFNPLVHFMLENVIMQKKNLDVITEYLGVEPVLINSALVSAQTRKRYYWANFEITQPEDRDLTIADIAEDNPDAVKIKPGYWERKDIVPYYAKHIPNAYMDVPVATREVGRRLVPDGTRRDDKNGVIVRGLEINTSGKAHALTTVTKDSFFTVDGETRQPTPVEYERLQTMPDNYTKAVPDTHRYRLLGNGWTAEVVKHILGGIFHE